MGALERGRRFLQKQTFTPDTLSTGAHPAAETDPDPLFVWKEGLLAKLDPETEGPQRALLEEVLDAQITLIRCNENPDMLDGPDHKQHAQARLELLMEEAVQANLILPKAAGYQSTDADIVPHSNKFLKKVAAGAGVVFVIAGQKIGIEPVGDALTVGGIATVMGAGASLAWENGKDAFRHRKTLYQAAQRSTRQLRNTKRQ